MSLNFNLKRDWDRRNRRRTKRNDTCYPIILRTPSDTNTFLAIALQRQCRTDAKDITYAVEGEFIDNGDSIEPTGRKARHFWLVGYMEPSFEKVTACKEADFIRNRYQYVDGQTLHTPKRKHVATPDFGKIMYKVAHTCPDRVTPGGKYLLRLVEKKLRKHIVKTTDARNRPMADYFDNELRQMRSEKASESRVYYISLPRDTSGKVKWSEVFQ